MNPNLPSTEKLNPFLSIWLRPRKTFLSLFPRFMDRHIIALAAVFGFLNILNQAAQDGQGDFLAVEIIFFVAIIIGPLGGYALLYVLSTYLRWVFTWFKGRVETRDIRLVMAWSLLPAILGLTLWVPFMLIYGQGWFSSTVSVSSSLVLTLIPLLTNLQYLLFGWSIVLLLIGLATITDFSEAKSLLVMAVAAGIIAVPLLYLSWLLPGS